MMTAQELARLEVLQLLDAGVLCQGEAGVRLRLSVRQIKRLVRAYRRDGPAAVGSKRRGRPSNHRVDPGLIERALDLIRRHYADFGPTLAAEKLLERDGLLIRRETLRKAMIAHELWYAGTRRSRQYHPPRERRAQFGELIQGDGSPHAWFEQRGPRCTLLVFIDDATSKIVGGRFAKGETTEAYFALAKSYFLRYGKPLAFYVDKSSIFTTTRSRKARPDLTQFARAMQELNIELICANSPQAKGRVERANRTLQNRLVKELRLREIATIEAANAYLDDFIEEHNRRFSVAPRCEGDAHRTLAHTDNLSRILCSVIEHKLSKNLTLQHKGHRYKILAEGEYRRLQYSTVNVRENEDGISIDRDGRILAFEPLTYLDQRPVIEAKALNDHLDRSRLGPRTSDPAKVHKPAPQHPWKKRFSQSTAPAIR